jgi:DNA mismatch endonuclease (patch repair protein)
MASVGQSRTKPERIVASFLKAKGIRFKRNLKSMPGTPDLVLVEEGTVLFVHGCFWHGHKNCNAARQPSTNVEYWRNKINANIRRDIRKARQLRRLGWSVVTIWQCKLRKRCSEATLTKLLLKIGS